MKNRHLENETLKRQIEKRRGFNSILNKQPSQEDPVRTRKRSVNLLKASKLPGQTAWLEQNASILECFSFYCECNLNLDLTLETIIFHVLEFVFILLFIPEGHGWNSGMEQSQQVEARPFGAKILFEMCVRNSIPKGSGTQEMSLLRKRSFQRARSEDCRGFYVVLIPISLSKPFENCY